MNKVLNILLVAAAVTFGSGVLVFGSAASTVGFDFAKLSTSQPFTYQDYESSKAFSLITVSEANADLKVYKNTSAELKITYGENNLEKYTFSETENVLKISVSDATPWFSFFNWNSEVKVLALYLPNTFEGTLTLSTKNGSIALNDYSGGALSLATDNGSITATNIVSTGRANFTTSNGTLDVNGISALSVSLEDDNGSESVKDLSATEALTVQNANGAIAVSAIDVSSSISLHTSTGSISGDVKGPSSDYTISSHATIGSDNLPSYWVAPTGLKTGSKTLTAETSVGSINLSFK
jgi:DUF4097 and DUF4098 domain-containing protein YvlB